ncbi:MAG: EAL domain-containing protein [Proteobacteria bacterium]|nr:EAL domain-containing protein [Pseudomonadota bacterium]
MFKFDNNTEEHIDAHDSRIIIIDDDDDFTESLRELLESRDLDVITANNIFSTKKLIDEFKPKVALIDIRLDDGSGVDLLQIIVEKYPNIVCIMLTAYATMDTAIESLRLGAYDYLRKPIGPNDLFAVLDRSFEKAELTEDKLFTEYLLNESEQKYRDLVTNIPGAVYRCANDADRTMHYISPNIYSISGYPADDFIDNTIRSFASIIHPDDTKMVADKVSVGLEQKKPYVIEYRIIDKESNIRWVYEKGQGIYSEDGELAYTNGAIFDITESHELSEKLSYQATHDVLTGLVNRSEFEHRLNRVLQTIYKHNSEHALLYLDLDQFKIINDTCGHIAGDELLRQLGLLLSKEVRKRDTVARLGGDEFGVLMEHCSLKQAKRVANKLKKAIDQFRFLWEEKQFNIGVSIGLVIIDETAGDITDLLKKADVACYAAKEQGRNRIHVFKIDDKQLAKQYGEMQWVNLINRALEENTFFLAFQAVIPLKKSKSKTKYDRFELLIRMKLNNKTILPGKFLPAAERYGLATKIDQWVITTAFVHFSKNKELLDATVEISINLSGQSISDDKFLEFVKKAFTQYKIPQDKICFEITETAAIANLAKANRFIDALKKGGCKFALDDFGSGLSSFAYLKTLHIDYLKIDGFFVKGIINDPIDYAMVNSINEIGHEMGLKTIAEFVENKKILDKLKQIGVDYVQGYHFGEIQTLIQTS